MPKFTEGEWSTFDDGKTISVWAGDNDCIINEQLHQFSNEDYSLECKANLSLIASAPDMYELLVDIVENYEAGEKIDDQIIAILSKARGE